MTRYVVVGGGIVGLATAHRILLDRPGAAGDRAGEGVARRGAPDRPQLRRHPRRRLLQAGQPQGDAVPGRQPRRWSTSATRARHPVRGLRQADRRHRRRPSCPGCTRCTSGPSPTGCRSRLIGPAEAARVRAARAPASRRCTWRRPASSTSARSAASSPSCSPRAGAELRLEHRGSPGIRAGTRSSSAPRPASSSADVLVNCAGPARRPGRPAGRRRPAGADHPVPRRVLRAAPRAPAPRPRADLPGARPAVPVPRRPPHQDDRRQRPRRAERRARPGPRGLPLARDQPARRRRTRSTYPGCGGWPAGTCGTGSTEVRRSLSPSRFAASLARLVPERRPPPTSCRPAPGVRAQAVTPDGDLVDDFLHRAPRTGRCTC